MGAALKIVFDVAVFRLRRLEMANMAAALAIMSALHLPGVEVAGRMVFALLLNLFVYLNNDWLDLEQDLASEDKNRDKTRFMADHPGAALGAQFGLLGILTVFALWWGGGLWLPLLLGGGVCWAYSKWLKRMPMVDVLAMIAWGVAMPMVGVPWGDPAGLALLGQLGLFSGVFESIQVLRDRDEDEERGVQTTAVVLGAARTHRMARGLMFASGIYAALAFHPLLAAFPVAAAFVKLGDDVHVYWNKIRLILGLCMLAETLLVWWWG